MIVERIAASAGALGEGMPIRRALPTAQRRLVGPWCFLDHFGPADVGRTPGMRVGPHPHIGLQTLTWLIEGEILHRDSLGSMQAIRPGAVNLMTAGRGISHSEESPQPHPPGLHGVQFWIALPDRARDIAPAFEHHPQVPVIERDGCRVSVLAGEFLGQRSPARVHSPLCGAYVELPAGATLALPLRTGFEHGFIVTHGTVAVGGEALAPGTLLYLPPGAHVVEIVNGPAAAGLVLVGGEPLGEDVLLWWNFVARTREEIWRATRDWNGEAEYFGEVRGYDGKRLVAPPPPWSEPPTTVVDYP